MWPNGQADADVDAIALRQSGYGYFLWDDAGTESHGHMDHPEASPKTQSLTRG
jgi:hypothetical protein